MFSVGKFGKSKMVAKIPDFFIKIFIFDSTIIQICQIIGFQLAKIDFES